MVMEGDKYCLSFEGVNVKKFYLCLYSIALRPVMLSSPWFVK